MLGLIAAALAGIPDGFEEIDREGGAAVYKGSGGYAGRFVVTADLRSTRMCSGLGERSLDGRGQPLFQTLGQSEHWARLAMEHGDALLVVFNGQFSVFGANPSGLAFGVKAEGNVISPGYGTYNEYPGQQVVLTVDSDAGTAAVSAYDGSDLSQLPGDVAVVGLTEDADKGPGRATGRTFLGVDDADGDGAGETLLVFVAASVTQKEAADTLRAFGADAVLMLDGGGSSQLMVRGNGYVSTSRPLPHSLCIITQK